MMTVGQGTSRFTRTRRKQSAALTDTSNMARLPHPRRVRPFSPPCADRTGFWRDGAWPYAILTTMITDAQSQHAFSAEYAFIVAIIHQAHQDLRAQAPAQERAASR